MNLWMVYTCNMKRGLENTKDGKKVHVLCIVDQNRERSLVVLEDFRHLVDSGCNIKNGGIVIQGRVNWCWKMKKWKLKTKKLLKITILALCENCPNTEFFLVRILLYADWIQKNADQKKLRIWNFSRNVDEQEPPVQSADSQVITIYQIWYSWKFQLNIFYGLGEIALQDQYSLCQTEKFKIAGSK